MSTKLPKVSTVLTRAARHIEKYGLAKGDYFKYRNGRPLRLGDSIVDEAGAAKEKGCKACAWGGIYVGAHSPSLSPSELFDLAEEAAGYVSPLAEEAGFWGIPVWNDAPERTKEEVVAGLKEAAKAARKDGK